MPLSTVPISPLPGQEDQSARLAASAEVGQVEGAIPQIYQDWKRDMDVLWEMVMAAEKPTERHALQSGISALKILLSERGYDA